MTKESFRTNVRPPFQADTAWAVRLESRTYKRGSYFGMISKLLEAQEIVKSVLVIIPLLGI